MFNEKSLAYEGKLNVEKKLSPRSERQLSFEKKHFVETYGKPFAERLWIIRNAIFGDLPTTSSIMPAPETDATLNSLRLGHLVSESRVEIINQFTPFSENAKKAMDSISMLIDEEYTRIATLLDSDEKRAAIWRLAGMILTSGILIQPRTDGNKQTFRLLALSYIHDLAPELKSKFFPILDGEVVRPELDPTIPMLGALGVKPEHQILKATIPKIETKSETESKLIQLSEQLRQIIQSLILDDKWKKHRSFKVAKSRAIEPTVAQINSLLQPDNQIKKQPLEFKVARILGLEIRIPTFRGYNEKRVLNEVIRHFNRLGYPLEMARATIIPAELGQIDRSSWIITQAFVMEQGIELIRKFIQTNLSVDEFNMLTESYQKIINLFSAHALKMEKVLEDESLHFA